MLKSIATAFAAILCLAGSLSAQTLAQDAFVIVPDRPNTVVPVNGCFRSNQYLFGPHRLTFCLDRAGTYQVRGGGVRCDGWHTWWISGPKIFIDLERASCGGGVAWEEARIECRKSGTSSHNVLTRLQCTYFPIVPGRSPTNFTASRI